MKYAILTMFSVLALYGNAQNNSDSLDVNIDDRPARLNPKTGKFRFLDKKKSTTLEEKPKTIAKSKITNKRLHTVAKGDTFYSISNHYGISMAQLKSLNSIKDNNLEIGQQLKIGYSKTAKISDHASNKTYTVRAGDTLYHIAKINNISVSQLKMLNNLESNTIDQGQVLKLQ